MRRRLRAAGAGLGIEHLQAAIGRARLVIARVNPELPWTHGDTVIEPGSKSSAAREATEIKVSSVVRKSPSPF
jgi:hypothetical protein